jgi:hypothetical protein
MTPTQRNSDFDDPPRRSVMAVFLVMAAAVASAPFASSTRSAAQEVVICLSF